MAFVSQFPTRRAAALAALCNATSCGLLPENCTICEVDAGYFVAEAYTDDCYRGPVKLREDGSWR